VLAGYEHLAVEVVSAKPIAGVDRPFLQATEHIKKMRGDSQSHLMKADDNNYYVVKFQGNPQGTRILVNDYLGSCLAREIGLSAPPVAVIEVDGSVIEHSTDLTFVDSQSRHTQCQPGLHFGSKYVGNRLKDFVIDYLPEPMTPILRNTAEFAGVLAFDKWTCNADGRQVIYSKTRHQKKLSANFIDQGYCFNAIDWSFPDSPLRGAFIRNEVYIPITGWDNFEPWLSRIEAMEESTIAAYAEAIPPEWYDNDHSALEKLVHMLYTRRRMVRRLIDEFRKSSRQPFANWRE
jgi:hypothetical protein